ncbi:hypothetical protein BB560_004431, partial [Smittium megazygosporum]
MERHCLSPIYGVDVEIVSVISNSYIIEKLSVIRVVLLRNVTKSLSYWFWCMNSPSEKSFRESQTAISGLGRRVGQLDAGQTENAEYQGTEPDQFPHPTATRLVLFSSSSKGSLHG